MPETINTYAPVALGAIGGLLTLGAAVWGGLTQVRESAVRTAFEQQLSTKNAELAAKSDEVKSLALENADLSKKIARLVTGGESLCYLNLDVDQKGEIKPRLCVDGEYPVRGLWMEIANLTKRDQLKTEGKEPQEHQHLWRRTITQESLRPESRLVVTDFPLDENEQAEKQVIVISIEQLNLSAKQICYLVKSPESSTAIAHRVFKQLIASDGTTEFAEVEQLRRLDAGLVVRDYDEFLNPKQMGF